MDAQVTGTVLGGVRVLDFGRYIAGPWCAAMLADFGADVIRIERITGGDDRYQYPVTDKGEGACFLQMNRNKRGFTLNPMKPKGGEILRRLVSTANVVIANLPADTRQQMGLDYAHLKSIKPDIILTAISAFGEEGPYGNRVGFDGIGQAMSGATYLSGLPGQPTKSYASWVDYSTAMFSAFGTLAAIFEHHRTGRGQEVQTTLFGSAVTIFNFNIIEQALAKVDRVASGNRSQSSCPADISKTKDGYIQIQTVGNPLFERWVRLMGEPHWLDDPRFKTDDLRARNGEILSRRTHEWAANYTTHEALELLAKERIPAGPGLFAAERAGRSACEGNRDADADGIPRRVGARSRQHVRGKNVRDALSTAHETADSGRTHRCHHARTWLLGSGDRDVQVGSSSSDARGIAQGFKKRGATQMRTGNNRTRGIWKEWFHWIASSFVAPAIGAPGRPHPISGTSSGPGGTVYICGLRSHLCSRRVPGNNPSQRGCARSRRKSRCDSRFHLVS